MTSQTEKGSENTPDGLSPPPKRAVAFIDGQNLFHAAKEAFGCDYPNYHPIKLAERICHDRRWSLREVRFYTGVPKAGDNLFWHNFWAAKRRFLTRDKRLIAFTRDLHYRTKQISFNKEIDDYRLPDGSRVPAGTRLLQPNGRDIDGEFFIHVAEEKGIDVRIALEMIRLTYRNEFDIGIVFSQDQDLSEAVSEIRQIALDQRRSVAMYSEFPCSTKTTNRTPIRGTTTIEIDEALYNACLDPSNYHRRR